MSQPSICVAHPTHAAQLTSISLAAKQHWGYPDAWMAHWLEDLRIAPAYIAQHRVYTLALDREIAGFIALEQQTERVEIAHLWVLPQHMGKGYGKLLLDTAIPLVVPEGAELVVLSDPHAEGFYQKQGFATVGRQESYPAGRYLPLMKKVYTGAGAALAGS